MGSKPKAMTTKPTPGAGKPTPKQINDIVDLARVPIPLPIICRFHKLEEATVEEWLKQGRTSKPGSDLRTFADDYDAAGANAEIMIRTHLAKHAGTDPNAAFKLMEIKAKDAEAPPTASRPLQNPLHEALCQLMATHGMKAGPAWQKLTGCTPKSAKANASRALTNDSLKNRIISIQTTKLQSNQLTREDRLRGCHRIATSATASDSDQLRAIKLDAELKGELIGKQELSGPEGVALPSVIPAIIIQAPRQSGRRGG